MFINTYFSQEVGPSLVTLMLNNIESISRIKDVNAFLAVRMELDAEKHPFLDPIQFALIEIPSSLKRFVVLPSAEGKTHVMLLDDLIRTQLSTIFDVFQNKTIEAHMVKFSRDAELDIDDDLSKSYVEKVAESVKDRSQAKRYVLCMIKILRMTPYPCCSIVLASTVATVSLLVGDTTTVETISSFLIWADRFKIPTARPITDR